MGAWREWGLARGVGGGVAAFKADALVEVGILAYFVTACIRFLPCPYLRSLNSHVSILSVLTCYASPKKKKKT